MKMPFTYKLAKTILCEKFIIWLVSLQVILVFGGTTRGRFLKKWPFSNLQFIQLYSAHLTEINHLQKVGPKSTENLCN